MSRVGDLHRLLYNGVVGPSVEEPDSARTACILDKPSVRCVVRGRKQVAQQRSKQQISEIMRQVKSRDTKPEVAFRKALWARGVRYRLHDSGLPGKPDIVIPRARLVASVRGNYPGLSNQSFLAGPVDNHARH